MTSERHDMKLHAPRIGLIALVAALTVPGVHAHGGSQHGASSSRHDATMASDTPFGRTGDPVKASRTIEIAMTDDMRFTPSVLEVKRGETVRLRVANRGQVLHELVLGTPDLLKRHAEAMKKFPGMEHEDAYMTHVPPGAQGEIVWQFSQAGRFEFACLLPGHFEAGMSGRVIVE